MRKQTIDFLFVKELNMSNGSIKFDDNLIRIVT